MGDYAAARPLYEEPQRLCETLGNDGLRLFSLRGLGEKMIRTGDVEQARRYFADSLRPCHGEGDGIVSYEVLERLAATAKQQAQYERALTLYSTTLAPRERNGSDPDFNPKQIVEQDLAFLRKELQGDAFDTFSGRCKTFSS